MSLSTETSINLSQRPMILVVDDDERLRKLLKKFLTEKEFNVFAASNSNQADIFREYLNFDLIICDVMMPEENGFSYVNRLRNNGDNIPLLLLTAMGETSDKINGFEAGADDYLSKPFDPLELVLRIKSILKRTKSNSSSQTNKEIKFSVFRYNFENKTLYKGSEKVHLSDAETQILDYLIKNRNKEVSREDLANITNNQSNIRTIDVQITRLRQRIETIPSKPQYITTLRGIGYSFILE
ncbi:MAG: response regulator [Alphaproteobacteria bacterium]|nr:response regulator [Alphaproteobacteria bacterium]